MVYHLKVAYCQKPLLKCLAHKDGSLKSICQKDKSMEYVEHTCTVLYNLVHANASTRSLNMIDFMVHYKFILCILHN